MLIPAASVLTPSGWTGPATVRVEDGVIVAIDPAQRAESDDLLVPGFVDMQVNGVDDVDVASARGDDWSRLDRLLLDQGVTTWCPTLVSAPLDRYERPLARIAEAMARPGAARPTIAGAHLEGPFLGRSPGAHPRDLIIPIDLEWLAALPAHVALVTLAAEQEDAVAAAQLLTAAGRLVSIGHTQADGEQFDTCVAAGARLTTHLFNGMSGVHHREPGVAVHAMTNPDVCASIIADGVHVHPRVLRLAAQALGRDRMVLVTDAVAWRAGSVGVIGMELRDGAPRLPDGTLAGSAVTMDAAIRTCVAAGIPLEQAVVAASTNPARLLDLHDRGTIEPGRRADLVALRNVHVTQVWVAGEATR
ncbi:MAG: N-acetylglucosamine-6-phosphate deacetylase [Ilumatobacteraceae bacterium]